MKHEKPPYHYELPNGTISVAFDDIYGCYIAGAKATWGTDMKVGLVKVFNVDGQYVPSYEYCDDCNYDSHFCGGCGDSKTHEQYGDCDCRDELDRAVTA